MVPVVRFKGETLWHVRSQSAALFGGPQTQRQNHIHNNGDVELLVCSRR
jgi:hypothetical protein